MLRFQSTKGTRRGITGSAKFATVQLHETARRSAVGSTIAHVQFTKVARGSKIGSTIGIAIEITGWFMVYATAAAGIRIFIAIPGVRETRSLTFLLTIGNSRMQNQTWIRALSDATKLWSVCDQRVRHSLIARASLLRLVPFMRMLLTNGVQSIWALKRFSVAVCFFEDTFSEHSISEWIAFSSL
jgi:hypothetical protein